MATPDASRSPSPTTSPARGGPEKSPPRSAREEEKQKKIQGLEKQRGSPSKSKTDSRVSVISRRSQAREEEEEEEEEEWTSNSSLLSGGDSSRAIKPVQAFVRVKPTAHFAQDMIKFGADNKSIDIHIEKDARGGTVNNSSTDWSFRMDGLLHNTSQDQVYEAVAKDLVAEALRGCNGTIMCYGQTGAGKTYTMTGATSEYKHRGIIPRAIQQVFKAAAGSLSLSIRVRISYLEIYNEALFDLLCPGLGRGCRATPLAVLDSPRGVHVRGLSIHPVSHEEEALHLLFQGETNRVIAEHALNKNSSRSHCIFTIYLECRSRTDTDLKGIKSKITLIDLAGSERLSKITAAGQIRRENSYINRSLTFLEQIILALADPSRGHVPFRQSKLTHVLKDSLGGNCNTVLVTNICGEAAHVGETLSSLRFATRMRWITAEPLPNVTFDREVSVKALEEEIELLKQELAMQDMFANHYSGTYSPLSGAQRAAIKSQVHKYLRGAIEEIDIVSIQQIQEVFKQFKVIVSQQQEDVEAKLRSRYILIDKGEFPAGAEIESDFGSDFGWLLEDEEEEEYKEEDEDEGGVGDLGDGLEQEVEKLQKEALEPGTSSSSPVPGEKKEDKKSDEQTKKEKLLSPSLEREGSAAPETQEESPTKDVEEEEGASEQDRTDSERELPSPSSGEECQQPRILARERRPTVLEELENALKSFPPSKAEAFELFKQGAGREISSIFRDNKNILLARQRSSNSVARRIIEVRREMEGVREALQGKKRKRCQEGEYMDEKGQVIIDEKEFSLILRLKELKEEHRAGYAELQDLKAEIQYCQELVDKCRRRLILEFEIWYNESFLIPEDVREALRPGGSIRPGMIPINRVMCLDEDEQDRFERMQETNLPDCPGSTPFYRAKMKIEQQHTFDRTMLALQQMRRRAGILRAAGKNKPLSLLHST